MRNCPFNARPLRALAVAWLLAMVPQAVRAAEPVQYLQADARITGSQVYFFLDGRTPVALVLGDFRVQMGDREVRGRDGVVWIRTVREDAIRRYDMLIYAEGGASVVEGDSSLRREQALLVRAHIQGRIVAPPVNERENLQDLPVFQRARAFRMSHPVRDDAPRPQRPPVLIVRSGQPETAAATGPDQRPRSPGERAPAATAPAPRPGTDEGPAPDAPEAEAPAAGDEAVPPLQPRQPVSFHARLVSSERREGRRVLIGREDVYLSQGSADEEGFLELRGQAAVVFTERHAPVEGRGPGAPAIEGATTLTDPAGAGESERIVGVYLEGDVVISRGERWLRCRRAYYDFTTHRAVLIDAVFRTRQEQRNIPIWIRAAEARLLSVREAWFRDAKVSTSDFHSPTYHIGAKTAYVRDTTPYDPTGMRIGERSWMTEMWNTTFNVRSVPIFWSPYQRARGEQLDTPLHTASIGMHGHFGWGVATDWYFFRLLGLIEPEGFDTGLTLEAYARGVLFGLGTEYERETFSGYSNLQGVFDTEQEDDFGRRREDIAAPRQRGRFLLRHKHLLGSDWMLQAEVSYLCDRNFLEQFYRNEFYNGKEQETLLYARKQTDSWSFSSLVKTRLNRFQTQTESYPELRFNVPGESLLEGRVLVFHESRAGVKRWRPDNDTGVDDSPFFGRFDTRNEVDIPLRLGPVSVVPYAMGRGTYWSSSPDGGEVCRPYGQVGVRAATHLWRVFNEVESEFWDVHRLRHILTPRVAAFVSGTQDAAPSDVYPMDPDVETRVRRTNGWSLGLYQRLQTRRGPVGERETVDWMRFNVVASFFPHSDDSLLPADGRWYYDRPENSIVRDHINAEYFWHISDSTTFLADTNYDWDQQKFTRLNGGISVDRSPRLGYYFGCRSIEDYESVIGTVAARYKLNEKYSVRGVQQYDFRYDDGTNQATSFSIERRWPRWVTSFTFSYIESREEMRVYLTIWPEGISEAMVRGGIGDVFEESDRN